MLTLPKYRRFLIIGNTGNGKSTLAARISAQLGIPVVELDHLYWNPAWSEADDGTFGKAIAEATQPEAWIVEGNYHRFRHLFWDRVEVVIVLDCSLLRSLTRIVLRTFRRWITRDLCCNGNQESPLRLIGKKSLLLWAIRTNHRRYGEFLELMQRAKLENKVVFHLRTDAEIFQFLKECFSVPLHSSDP